MKANDENFHGGYYWNAFETTGDVEGSGSSGRNDAEITVSKDSSAPARKLINLNSNKQDRFGIPLEVLPLSHMPPTERKGIIHRLRFELEQIRVLQKKVEVQRINAVTVSSSSDILSCSNGTIVPKEVINSGSWKKMNPNPIGKGRDLKRNSAGRFKSAKQTSVTTAPNVMVMKQCETLLTRLLSHRYGWVFKAPVDVVGLKIPDYLTIIKHPMDFGTIRGKLNSGSYSSPLEFLADVRLTFKNAMEYNPKGHDVHAMAETLSEFFEVRWRTIEKKLPKNELQVLPAKSGPCEELRIPEVSPIKKWKLDSHKVETVTEPVRRAMTDEEKRSLGRELESLLAEMPLHIVDFLREHSANGRDAGEEEIEIDIDDLSDDTLLTLRSLLDDYFQEKQKSRQKVEHCVEVLNESGLSNSSMHQRKADRDVDIGRNEPPVSSYPPVAIEKDAGCKDSKCISSSSSSGSESGSSSESDSDDAKAVTQKAPTKVPENLDAVAQLDDKSCGGDPLERIQSCTESVSGLDQLEQMSLRKPGSVESDSLQDGESAPSERQVSPEKLIRAALLKNRFADTILKAREKTLTQADKGDPEKFRREMEERELQKKKEKARLQAEARAAEDAQRRAEEAAAVDARRKREVEREAARQALLKMEKTVEINENSRFLEDLEMLRVVPVEQLPSSVDETSPDHSEDGLGGFRFGGNNPLEQLGLFMKQDEDDEEGDLLNVNDMEEGEID